MESTVPSTSIFELPPGWQAWPNHAQIVEHAGDAEFRTWLARRPNGELLLGHFDEERTFVYGRASGYAFPNQLNASAWWFCPIDGWGQPVALRSSSGQAPHTGSSSSEELQRAAREHEEDRIAALMDREHLSREQAIERLVALDHPSFHQTVPVSPSAPDGGGRP